MIASVPKTDWRRLSQPSQPAPVRQLRQSYYKTAQTVATDAPLQTRHFTPSPSGGVCGDTLIEANIARAWLPSSCLSDSHRHRATAI